MDQGKDCGDICFVGLAYEIVCGMVVSVPASVANRTIASLGVEDSDMVDMMVLKRPLDQNAAALVRPQDYPYTEGGCCRIGAE